VGRVVWDPRVPKRMKEISFILWPTKFPFICNKPSFSKEKIPLEKWVGGNTSISPMPTSPTPILPIHILPIPISPITHFTYYNFAYTHFTSREFLVKSYIPWKISISDYRQQKSGTELNEMASYWYSVDALCSTKCKSTKVSKIIDDFLK
jgi:hypothetical protein